MSKCTTPVTYDEAYWVRVKKNPEWVAWFDAGGLDKFAKARGLPTDFTKNTHKVPFEVEKAYRETMNNIPGVKEKLDNTRIPMGTPNQQTIWDAFELAGEGWYPGWESPDEDEEDTTSKHEDFGVEDVESEVEIPRPIRYTT